jgi:uncharacterized metal-binding protein YceD (DUF177 family)
LARRAELRSAPVARHTFSVALADLEYGDREIDEEIPLVWLETALSGTEATPRGQPGHLSVSVTKSGRDVMVRGRATAGVTVPCARTLDPVDVDLDAEIFLLLAPAGSRAEPGARRPRRQRDAAQKKKAGQKRGPGSKATEPEEPLDEAGAARDTYDADEVVLDEFVREFLLLELPMFPLRADLRSDEAPAISSPLEAHPDASKGIDPRLAPLAAIASRLSEKNGKKE